MAYKINKADECECITITITKEKYPILYSQKVNELYEMCENKNEVTRSYVEKLVEGMEIELELCYSDGNGLFAIEADAIESCGSSLFNPYSGENLEDCDE